MATVLYLVCRRLKEAVSSRQCERYRSGVAGVCANGLPRRECAACDHSREWASRRNYATDEVLGEAFYAEFKRVYTANEPPGAA